MAEQKGSPLVSIARVIGGVSVAIVAIIVVFAKDQLSVAVWVVAALAIMGIGLGFFALKSSKPQ